MSFLQISSEETIVSLVDLDESFFKIPTTTTWKALREILLQARSLLWVTHSRLSGNPYANMIIVLLRSALLEIPTLDAQFLDFEDIHNLEAYTIAETLMRLKASIFWQQEGAGEAMLSTIELELVMDKKGRAMIPRLIMNQKMNDRYNSSRRSLVSSVSSDSQAFSVESSLSGFALHQEVAQIGQIDIGGLRVSYSFLSTIRVAEYGNMFLFFGKDCHTGRQLVALSTKHASIIYPWKTLAVPTSTDANLSSGSAINLLSQTAYRLIASVILTDLVQGDQVLVHEPTYAFAAVLTEQAKLILVEVVITTCNMTSTNPNWLIIPPTSPERLYSSLSKKASVFKTSLSRMMTIPLAIAFAPDYQHIAGVNTCKLCLGRVLGLLGGPMSIQSKHGSRMQCEAPKVHWQRRRIQELIIRPLHQSLKV